MKQTVDLVHFMVETKNLEYWYKERPGVPVYKDIKVDLYPAEQTVIRFVNEGKSAINIQNRLSASFSQYVPILQNMLITGNVTQALDKMEAEYVQSGRALGLNGF